MELTITRMDLVDLVDEILAVMRGESAYRPHNPVLCSDGNGLRIGSDLHEWAFVASLDVAEAWLDGLEDVETGSMIVADMDIPSIRDFLSITDDDTLTVCGDR